jgi:uncharacterized protein (TIGR00369 family)
MFRPISIDEINHFAKNSLVEHLSIKIVEIGKDYLCASMPVDSTTHQPMGFLHGGASVALAETVGSFASFLIIDPELYHVFGIALSANHIRSKRSGEVRAYARPLHIGKTTHLWNIEIKDEDGQLISTVRLTNMLVSVRKD